MKKRLRKAFPSQPTGNRRSVALASPLWAILFLLTTMCSLGVSATISGKVLNRNTLQPLAHNELIFIGANEFTTNFYYLFSIPIEVDGSYTLDNIPVGSYRLYLESEIDYSATPLLGYAKTWWNSSGQDINFPMSSAEILTITDPAQELKDINFYTDLASWLSGAVFQSDGVSPLLTLDRIVIWNGRLADNDPCTYTLESGSYLSNLGERQTTDYLISVHPGSYILLAMDSQDNSLITFYTDHGTSLNCSDAQVLTVSTYGQTLSGNDFSFDLPIGGENEELNVSLSGSGSGSVTLSTTGLTYATDFSENIISGTTVTLTAKPNDGSFFSGWSGNGCSDMLATCTVTMDTGRDIQAQFISVETAGFNVANTRTVANHFAIWLDITIDEQLSEMICNDYTFSVQEDFGGGNYKDVAHQDSCLYLADQSTTERRRYKVDFTLLPRKDVDPSLPLDSRASYFADGRLTVAPLLSPTNRAIIPRNWLDNFAVYGTTFDMEKDAFSFDNGSWRPGQTNYLYETKNDMAVFGDVIANYLHETKRGDFWNHVGWSNVSSSFHMGLAAEEQESMGLCHGMATAAAATFNDKAKTAAWGIGGTFSQWQVAMASHWDVATQRSTGPSLPFNTTSTVYDRPDNIETMKKIMYYFAGQSSFHGIKGSTSIEANVGDIWRGRDSIYRKADYKSFFPSTLALGSGFREEMINLLTQGIVTPVQLESAEGSHSILLASLISWNGHDKYLHYDNNYSYDRIKQEGVEFAYFSEWYLGDNSDYNCLSSKNKENSLMQLVDKTTGNGKKVIYHNIERILVQTMSPASTNLPSNMADFTPADPQNIYALRSAEAIVPGISLNANQTSETALTGDRLTTDNSETFSEIIHKDHIKVFFVGAQELHVSDALTHSPVEVLPFAAIEPDVATLQKNEAFITLYLPITDTYTLTAIKSPFFPLLKVYVTIPYQDGHVEYLNYEQLQTGHEDETSITFTVGRDNPDTSITRSLDAVPLTSYVPDYSASLQTSVPAPTEFSALYEGGKVTMQWSAPDHANFAHVKLIRKDNDVPISLDDGISLYEGSLTTFTDTAVSDDSIYYYGLYSVDSEETISQNRSLLGIDTSMLSISGTVTSEGQPVSGISIIVRDGNNREIDSTVTGTEGRYTLNNFVAGDYSLEAVHPSYLITDSLRSLAISTENSVENFQAQAQSSLTLLWNSSKEVLGETVELTWASRNIVGSELVKIEVDHGSGFVEIATVPADSGWYHWQVTGPEVEEASLRISLVNAPAVIAFTQFSIVPVPEFDLLLSVEGSGSGRITSSSFSIDCSDSCTTQARAGTLIPLTAEAEQGSVFTGWDSPWCEGSDPCIVSVTEDKQIKAHFARLHDLNIYFAGSGTGTVTEKQTGETFTADTTVAVMDQGVVSLTPSPAPLSSFAQWTGDCFGNGACLLLMEEEKNAYAYFVQDVDGDTLDDEWELSHFSSLAVASSSSDFDHDGYSDYTEWLNSFKRVLDPDGLEFEPTTKNTGGGSGYVHPSNILLLIEPALLNGKMGVLSPPEN
ncbi:MAG: carboxypeptidase regulatory-like domain-containing protein [Proteobacteria bacterium]|nr:carboxypeptidase regulatory-like domain-containing protein [Pseudomonadota bacterium]MBU1059237.1 carboxypeptidase regulatory-like domain-containing protein [Pseudomonadota bacterium]